MPYRPLPPTACCGNQAKHCCGWHAHRPRGPACRTRPHLIEVPRFYRSDDSTFGNPRLTHVAVTTRSWWRCVVGLWCCHVVQSTSAGAIILRIALAAWSSALKVSPYTPTCQSRFPLHRSLQFEYATLEVHLSPRGHSFAIKLCQLWYTTSCSFLTFSWSPWTPVNKHSKGTSQERI